MEKLAEIWPGGTPAGMARAGCVLDESRGHKLKRESCTRACTVEASAEAFRLEAATMNLQLLHRIYCPLTGL